MSARDRAGRWLWEDDGVGASLLRSALAPASLLFGAIVRRRNRAYDAGRGVHSSSVPVLSIGNLTVGGTGKTPFAAWCAAQLQARGAAPAIVMRGYGDDEWREHRLINPEVPVITNVDRVRGIADAAERGASVVVLDDGFQHRRAARTVDLVLLSADTWTGRTRLLPAGPWREPLGALTRAHAAVITIKSRLDARLQERVQSLRAAIGEAAPSIPVAEVVLRPEALIPVTPGALPSVPLGGMPVSQLEGQAVIATSAIGNPAAFEQVLADAGATVHVRRFPDHHAYTDADVVRVLRASPPDVMVVCTRKDAVKLAPIWPRTAPPLWYLSQTTEVRLGGDVLHACFSRVMTVHHSPSDPPRPTAG
jgi:tetraacyldisaccharide 4'-kinase